MVVKLLLHMHIYWKAIKKDIALWYAKKPGGSNCEMYRCQPKSTVMEVNGEKSNDENSGKFLWYLDHLRSSIKFTWFAVIKIFVIDNHFLAATYVLQLFSP